MKESSQHGKIVGAVDDSGNLTDTNEILRYTNSL